MTIAKDLKSTAKDAQATAKHAIADVADQAKDHVEVRASAAKQDVANEVGSVASALRSASDEMRAGSPQEQFVGHIAGSLADVSEEIQNKDFGEILNATSDFARRNPVAFLGGAALLGFAATRFIKASDTREAEYTGTAHPNSFPEVTS